MRDAARGAGTAATSSPVPTWTTTATDASGAPARRLLRAGAAHRAARRAGIARGDQPDLDGEQIMAVLDPRPGPIVEEALPVSCLGAAVDEGPLGTGSGAAPASMVLSPWSGHLTRLRRLRGPAARVIQIPIPSLLQESLQPFESGKVGLGESCIQYELMVHSRPPRSMSALSLRAWTKFLGVVRNDGGTNQEHRHLGPSSTGLASINKEDRGIYAVVTSRRPRRPRTIGSPAQAERGRMRTKVLRSEEAAARARVDHCRERCSRRGEGCSARLLPERLRQRRRPSRSWRTRRSSP